jgi:hypothetical protein
VVLPEVCSKVEKFQPPRPPYARRRSGRGDRTFVDLWPDAQAIHTEKSVQMPRGFNMSTVFDLIALLAMLVALTETLKNGPYNA